MGKITLTKESETLFIPLFGKSEMSREGKILIDKKAQEIVNSVEYDFTKNKSSKYLSIYMGIRAAIIDDYANKFIQEHSNAIILHLGCGLDSRIERITEKPQLWYDLDFPDVITLRKQFYHESQSYRMLSSSVMDLEWLNAIDSKNFPTLIIAEGLTMYLTEEEIKELFLAFKRKFQQVDFIFDAYSISSVKMSKYKKPGKQNGSENSLGA